jgi:hypothetical protein
MEKEKVDHYDVNEVIDRFNIEKIFNSAVLNQWVNIPSLPLKTAYQEVLEEVRQNLLLKWDEWNEEELKINFISFVLFVAQLNEPKRIATYFERKLSGKVNDIPISVKVDCMIATPMKSGRPKVPYFCMQEYKKSKGDSHDPEGQMLAAMILAQNLNADGKPLYGCWIQGKIWHFTVLQGTDYIVSQSFDATSATQIIQIVSILNRLKQLVL